MSIVSKAGSAPSTSSSIGPARAYLWSIDQSPPKPFPTHLLPTITFACARVLCSGNKDDTTLVARGYIEGYIELKSADRVAKLRDWLGLGDSIEFEQCKLADRELNIAKIEDATNVHRGDSLVKPAMWIIGERKRGAPAKRSDMDGIKEILREHGVRAGMRIVADKYPGQYVRYAKGIRHLGETLAIPRRDPGFTPRDWQQALIDIFKHDPHPRHIWWVLDAEGGAGKSRLTEHLCLEYDAIELDGRVQDMAYAYEGQRIVIFDLSRSTPVAMCNELYIAAEKLKNGRMMSTKYESQTKAFDVPHVVFFSNASPPVGAWSADRLQLITLAAVSPFSATSQPITLQTTQFVDPVPAENAGIGIFEKFLKQNALAKLASAKRKREEEDALREPDE